MKKNKNDGFKYLLEGTCVDTGMPMDIVESVVKAQFEFVSRSIRSGEMNTIMLPYIGKFRVIKKYVDLDSTSKSTSILRKVTKRPRYESDIQKKK